MQTERSADDKAARNHQISFSLCVWQAGYVWAFLAVYNFDIYDGCRWQHGRNDVVRPDRGPTGISASDTHLSAATPAPVARLVFVALSLPPSLSLSLSLSL